jgi:hypothetical protein
MDCKHDWHFTSDATMAMRCKKCGQDTGPRTAEQLAQDMMQDALTTKQAGALQPVAWTTDLEFDSDTEVIPAKHKGKLGTRTADIALYTAPPRRPWVGLTNEQINQYDYQYRDLLYDAEKMLKGNNT